MVDNNISCELNKKRTTVTKDTIEGLKETIRNLYLADDIPWVIGYSGGKDSTATLQLVWLAIEELSAKQLKNAKKIHVINTDTMVESPVISKWVRDSLEIMDIRAEQSGLPFVTHRLTPETDNTFWVNLLGRGYPFPRKKLRWCTDRLKIQPVNKFVKEQIAEHGEIILVIGTRKAESARRAKTMAYYEKKRVRELLSPSSTMANELVFSPLEDWTDDDVWIFLMQYRNPWGYSNTDLLTLYRGATADNECPLMVEFCLTGSIKRIEKYNEELAIKKTEAFENKILISDETKKAFVKISFDNDGQHVEIKYTYYPERTKKRGSSKENNPNTIFECFDREIICNEEKIENQEQFLRSIEFDDIKEIFDKCCFLSQDEHLQFLKAAKKSKAEGLNFLLDIPTEWEKEQKRVKDNIDILSNGKKKSTSYIPRLKNRKAEEEQKLTEFDKIVQENQENTQVPYHKLFINKDVIWDREQFPMDEIAYNNSMNEIDLLMYFSEHKQECANYYWNLPYQNLVKEYNGDKFISFAEYPLEYTYRFINLLKEEENIETEYQKEKRYRGILDCIQKNQFANLNWDFLRQEELLEIEVINFIKIQLEEIRSLKQMQGIVQEAILTLKESRKILVSKADIIMEKELISSKNCPLCGAAYADRDQLDTKIKEETNVLNRISDNTTTQIQTIQKSIYEDYLEKVEEKIQMKLENSISDETYTKLQKIKRNKAKVFEVEQLLQKIEIEIDDKGRTEEFLLEGYNMLIARIKEKLKPVSEELSMRLKEKKFEDYYERFYDKNPELFFYVNKEELCEKRIYINGIRHNFYITERDKRSKEIEKLEIRIKKLEKVHEELKRYSDALEEGIIEYKKKIISDIEPLLHVYTAKILQQKFNGKSIYISTNEAVDNIQFVNSMKDKQDILYSMSSGQLSAVAISFLLCMNQVYGKNNPCSILL